MYEVTVYNRDKETVVHSPNVNDLKLASGVVSESVNAVSTFNLSMHMNNPGYGKLEPLTTLVTVLDTQTNEYVFEGRVLFPTDTMQSSGVHSTAFICEAELGFLNDSTQTHGEYHDITVREFLQVIINNHNRDLADDPIDKQFVLGKVDVGSGTLYRYLGYEDTLATIKDKLIDRLGGELRVRKENGVRYLDYVQAIGELEETEIKLAKNLQSITKEVDPTDMITRLIPLGARIESEDEEATDASEARITIESVNNGKDYLVDEAAELALGTIVVGSEVFDEVNEPAILKTRGRQHLDAHNRIREQHSLTALDLSIIGKAPGKFKVGSWYPTFNPVMRIDEPLRVIAKTTDILEPWNNGLTIGDKLKTASQYQADANKQMRLAKELESRVLRLNEVNSQVRQSLGDLSTSYGTSVIELNAMGQRMEQLERDVQNRSGTLRIATFNIWLGQIDFAAYKEFAMVNRLDLIGFQEIKDNNSDMIKVYNLDNVKYVNARRDYGNAIQSNMALVGLEEYELPTIPADVSRRIMMKSRVVFEGKTISVYNTHLDANYDNTARIAQLNAIKQIMNADTTEYKVLIGDFNVRDKAHFDILDNLKSVQGHNGVWHDTWDVSIEPWDNGAIDNILVTPNIDILKVEMPLDKLGSDHYMLWADVRLR